MLTLEPCDTQYSPIFTMMPQRWPGCLNMPNSNKLMATIVLAMWAVDACVTLVRQIGAPTVFGNWETAGWRHLSPENQTWALQLPPIIKEKTFWLTHAAPLWPTRFTSLTDWLADRHAIPISQLFPYLHFESQALWDTVAHLSQAEIPLMFHGHTHRQIASGDSPSIITCKRLTQRTIDPPPHGYADCRRGQRGPSGRWSRGRLSHLRCYDSTTRNGTGSVVRHRLADHQNLWGKNCRCWRRSICFSGLTSRLLNHAHSHIAKHFHGFGNVLLILLSGRLDIGG